MGNFWQKARSKPWYFWVYVFVSLILMTALTYAVGYVLIVELPHLLTLDRSNFSTLLAKIWLIVKISLTAMISQILAAILRAWYEWMEERDKSNPHNGNSVFLQLV